MRPRPVETSLPYSSTAHYKIRRSRSNHTRLTSTCVLYQSLRHRALASFGGALLVMYRRHHQLDKTKVKFVTCRKYMGASKDAFLGTGTASMNVCLAAEEPGLPPVSRNITPPPPVEPVRASRRGRCSGKNTNCTEITLALVIAAYPVVLTAPFSIVI